MSDEFLARAKSNHFSALKQAGNDPEEYANRMRILGKYHSRDIHECIGDDGKTHRYPWHPRLGTPDMFALVANQTNRIV